MSEEIVNFSALERELQGALEADRKYQRENDAKFRALHQKVGSYEEFRDIVQASHLRPLDKKDKAGCPRKQPWNSLASSTSSTSSYSSYSSTDTHSQQHDRPTLPQTLPRNTSELNRCWRQLSGASRGRYRLLLALGGPALRDIFRAEVGFGLLGEFLVVLCEGLQPGDEGRVTEVLEGLTQTPRFSLNLALLSPSERGACEMLLSLLATDGQRGRGEGGSSGDVGGDGGEEKGREGEEGDIDEEEQGGETGGGGSGGERGREGERRGREGERRGREEEKRGREGERRGREGERREEECCSETTVGYRDTEKPNQRISDLMQLYGIQLNSTQL